MNAQLAEKPMNPTHFAGKRVLVLEDRLVNQAVIEGQLKKLGIDFTLVPNGIKALETLQNNQFDLILCDCSMPEMDGYEFTRTLRRQELSGQRIPIIALTANDSPEDVSDSSMAGMDDFMSKPVTADKLAAVLAKWLTPSAGPSRVMGGPATSAGNAPQVINLRILAEILGANEAETLNQVLKESLATVAASLSEVEAASNSGDPARLTSAVRNAKGEARCVAAIGLANLYAKLEQHAKNDDRAATRDLVARAATEVRLVEEFIRGHLALQT